jgi:hypothetical protein
MAEKQRFSPQYRLMRRQLRFVMPLQWAQAAAASLAQLTSGV